MPTITNSLPQRDEPIRITTFRDLIDTLPETIEFPLNIWIGGKLARYGQTSDNLVFLVEGEGDTSTELKLYFESISPIPATVSTEWRNEKMGAVRLYNEGALIIDKKTLSYTELPKPTKLPPIITLEEIMKKLPKQVEWKQDIYLTGGLVKNGWSGNDVDFMTDADTDTFVKMKTFFTNLLGVKVDVGNASMPEREPIYKYLIYKGGLCHIGG